MAKKIRSILPWLKWLSLIIMGPRCLNRILPCTRMDLRTTLSKIHNKMIVFITKVATKAITQMTRLVVKNIIRREKILKTMPLEKWCQTASNWAATWKARIICSWSNLKWFLVWKIKTTGVLGDRVICTTKTVSKALTQRICKLN